MAVLHLLILLLSATYLLSEAQEISSGLAASFLNRKTPGSPGEIRTTRILPTSSSTSFSLTLKFQWSPLSSFSSRSRGSIDFYGHLFGLETGVKNDADAKILASIDLWSKPNYIIMGKTFAGPSIQYTDASPKSLSTNWHKIGVSYDASTKTVVYTLDGWFNKTEVIEEPLGTDMIEDAFVRLGTNMRSDLNFQGLMDDVCVYSSALTLEQLTENVEGCKQHSSLVLSLLFDQDSTSTSPPSNYDDVSDAKVGYAVDHTSDGLLLGFGSNDVVKHAPSYPSAAPASSTTSSIVCESTASTCDLTAHILAACGTCTSITVPASPSFGSITVVDGSSPPASSTYVLTLTSSSPVTAAPSHVLSYTLTYGDASTAARTLHVLPNAAPKAHGVEGVEAAELVPLGSANVIKMAAFQDYDPEFQTVTSQIRVKHGCDNLKFFQFNSTQAQSLQPPADDDGSYSDDDSDDRSAYYYGYDMDAIYSGALDLDDYITVVDITDAVNSGSFISIQDYYMRVIVLSTHTASEYSSDYNCTMQYRIFDGELYSEVATKSVMIQEGPYIPTVSAAATTIQEDSDSTKILLTVTSSSPASSVVSLELPADSSTAGKFYHADGVTEIKKDLGSYTFSQYPTSATATSEWDAEGYNVAALLGPPDLYPAHGDNGGAWQPNGEVLEFSATLTVSTPVFLNHLTVYQTWSSGKIVSVETRDHDTEGAEFVTVYQREGDISAERSTTMASLEDIVICPTAFRASEIKINVRMQSFSDWYALDAVSVSGFATPASNVLTGDVSKIFFEPRADFNGDVDVSVSIIDCPFFRAKRMASEAERAFSVDLTVVAVDDAPVAGEVSVEVDAAEEGAEGGSFEVNIWGAVTNADGRALTVSFWGEGAVVVGLGSVVVGGETVVDNKEFALTEGTGFYFKVDKLDADMELEIAYRVEDAVSGLGDGGVVVVTVVGAGDGKSEVDVTLIVGIAIPVVALIMFVVCSREYFMQKKIEELEKHLILALAYSSVEQQMIEEQIETFRGDYKKMKAGKTGAGDGLDKLLIKKDEIESHEMIGRGSFGEVFKAQYRGQAVAVKTLRQIDHDNLERFREEILLSGDLHHANVVNMVGAVWEKELMALVMEFCEKGTSSNVLESEGASFTWDDPLLKWCSDVAKAMHYLHSVTYYDTKTSKQLNGIIHRDLKPDNCLVTDSYALKVADFGEARAQEENNTMTQVGTPLYIAPEIIKGDKYGLSVDVFSYAMTIFEFALKGRQSLRDALGTMILDSKQKKTGKRLTLRNVTFARISNSIINKAWRPQTEQITGNKSTVNMPRSMADLIKLCWSDNPSERPSFKEIIEFLTEDAKLDIEGMGTETERGAEQGPRESISRRTSTSGSLALRLAQARHKEKAERGGGGGGGGEGEGGGGSKRERALTEEVDNLKLEIESLREQLEDKGRGGGGV